MNIERISMSQQVNMPRALIGGLGVSLNLKIFQ